MDSISVDLERREMTTIPMLLLSSFEEKWKKNLSLTKKKKTVMMREWKSNVEWSLQAESHLRLRS